jgi:murein DD-endopeptidase MepM/ murein hydrolase activator NlpD
MPGLAIALATSVARAQGSTRASPAGPPSAPPSAAAPGVVGVSVRGEVLDAVTGAGLAGATITIPQWQLTAASDASGRFTIASVPAGRWVVRAYRAESRPVLAMIDVSGDSGTAPAPLTLRLGPSPASIPCQPAVTNAGPRSPVAPVVRATPAAPLAGTLVQFEARTDTDAAYTDSIVAISGIFLGQPVAFARRGRHRFTGIGAVPLDSTKGGTLALVATYASGATARSESHVDAAPQPVLAAAPKKEALHVAARFSAPPPAATTRRIAAESELAYDVGRASLGTEPLWRVPFIEPRPGPITSGFGRGREFNGTLTSRHTGTDFAGRIGDPVVAANRGVVAMIGDFFLAGTAIYVDHGGGLVTAYFHLSAVSVAVGDTVARGQRLGSVGATGRVTGPHLHWVVRYGTASVDALTALALEPPPDVPVVRVCGATP